MPSSNGFLRAETEDYFRDRRDAQELAVSCKAGAVLEAQHAHRQEHGIKGRGKISRRMVRNLNSFVSPELTDEDQEDIQREVARRRRLNGIDERRWRRD